MMEEMRKTIRVKFVDFYGSFDPENNDFMELLRKRYNVVLSDEPDYLFYSCFGYDYLNYDCIRIFYTGECIVPNFNECDYAIGFDRLSFNDRYIRMPLFFLFQYKSDYFSILNRKPLTMEDVRAKSKFCNFVYSNCFAQDKRTEIFEKLSTYKPVDSGGRYRNNIGGAVKDKKSFMQDYKFSIAFENTSYDGYATEKITEAFAAGTIPIYYGDPKIAEDFNEDSFINCHRYETLEDVVKRVQEIDQDDALYLKMINTPPFKISYRPLSDFMYHLFDMDINKAFRRPFSIPSKSYESMLKRHRFYERYIYKYYIKILNQITRIKRGTSLKRNRI